ncbi:hypothetical protein [Lentzea sp. NPDC051838]|uniref:hypothetical protein n=1 Tax=Lentzea sp. NPDC051838 TaxID=3154849 RepID=UPI003429BFCD
MHRRILAVAACFALAACGSGETATTTMHQQHAPVAAETTSSAPATTAFDVTVQGGSVVPASSVRPVQLGKPVRITIVSDEDDEVHVHGYDKKATLKAGQQATLEFTADQPGVFEVELHHQDLLLLQLQVS